MVYGLSQVYATQFGFSHVHATQNKFSHVKFKNHFRITCTLHSTNLVTCLPSSSHFISDLGSKIFPFISFFFLFTSNVPILKFRKVTIRVLI